MNIGSLGWWVHTWLTHASVDHTWWSHWGQPNTIFKCSLQVCVQTVALLWAWYSQLKPERETAFLWGNCSWLGRNSWVMPQSCREPSFMGKVILILDEGTVGGLGSKGSELVEGSSSKWVSLDGGPSSSSALGNSSNKSSKMPHRVEVFVPAKEAANYPWASFSRSDALLLSIAESCSIYKDWKVIVI